ncbi:zinc finger protein chinmo-like [Oppia nitens]|uniref:zinc finger protein chinmo-like n=1 Tax=Oppia nitens TaxID=1686743 RepID=UPI0023D9D23F|nr:zinc finger protein chinmo-like [Oppia nitens]
MTCFVYISGQRMDGQSRELREMYLSQLMTDVIIECIDGSVMAHKLVLSSLSQRLYQLLSKWSTSQLIVIILMDTKVDDMKSIVDCVYFGHQLVDIKRVNQLQQIANTFGLQLKTEMIAEESLDFNLIESDNNKSRLKDKLIEPMDQQIDQLKEVAIDLSLSCQSTNKIDNKNNSMKTIESIVANDRPIVTISQLIGPKRRRKRSYK